MNLKALRALHRHGGEASPHRTRTRLLAVGVVAVLTTALTGSLPALAVHTLDFCLQGDVNNPSSVSTISCGATGQVDWTSFFNADGSRKALPAGTAGTFTDSVFTPDFALPDKTTFATGSKDTLPITSTGSGNWQCSAANNLGAKVDLANTYATVERTSNGHIVLYYGSEIQSANGNHNQGIWLLQDNVGCSSATGTSNFSGSHVNGDLLFAVALTGGGSKPFSASVVAFSWNCATAAPAVCSPLGSGSLVALNSGNAIGGLCPAGTSPDQACAISNQTWNVTTPWVDNASNGNVLGPQQFFEGGIDVTAVEPLTPCFSRFLTDTRSSQSPTATLFDYTNGSLNTCALPTLATALKNADGSAVSGNGVTVGSQVYDTATLSGTLGTPNGTVDYNLYPSCTNNASGIGVGSGTFTTTTSPATYVTGTNHGLPFTTNPVSHVTLSAGTIPQSDTLQFTKTGTFYFTASYNGDGINQPASSPCEPIIINPKVTTLRTTASTQAAIVVGTTVTISDSATITGAFGTPGGTMTFTLNGPATTTSCGALITTIPNVPVTSATTSSSNYSFSPTSIGTYYWSATWTGDSNNLGSSHAGCSVDPVSGLTVLDSAEAVPVVPATPVLKTTMALTDTVTVSGGDLPTGTVTFTLYPTLDCSGLDPGNGQTVTLVNGTATTPNAVPISADSTTYSWKVTYNGNTNNNTVIDGCTPTSHEQVTTSYAGQ